MKLKTRIFWNLGPILHHYLTLISKAKRAKKMPEYYSTGEKIKQFQTRSIKLLKCFGIKLKVEGLENVPVGSCVIAPNHSTYFDPLIISAALSKEFSNTQDSRKFGFIARQEIAKRKSIKKIAEFINTYLIDFSKPREIPEVLKNFAEYIKNNKLAGIVFPEGTRTKDGKIGEFQSGAFRIAQMAYVPIVPTTINNACNAYDKSRKGILEVTVTFHSPIKPINFQTLLPADLGNLVRDKILSNYVEQNITSDETKHNKYSKRAKKE
ncbi:lysophospholipid acyltransferase family protein [Metamycoplasma hyosynoviae]|uniref:1-acyl-sn-glycerol-3-phosphate acyltransferase n=1 Tax=Metamycoplasma hyosynoviae TaxID=29559 RepID=A0A4P1QGS5_9BACT|nr:lysophospholipid acyltransferase family protein [Metamycoplasma hyosynoviae]ASI54125.1 acyl-phosphate glycerol 3-phosphate acyltransferase [Metamycoplasma hyosynoviae]MDC8900182.1 lysophospholipid acyltransferase family protein [Metamycoplasma hyosynoviae]MDC8900834.1 lysophospholipid acyltransferase family protein [Metamycoplasma hyosynoviae]MDC8911559.1 lysophospholipid acyltransferase family protein [Metamycoplasma hyosynoviae]MDC8912349.1 lysophospholipid acyltransferase family protein 